MNEGAQRQAYHLALDERLKRINLAIILPLHQLDLTECSLADNFKRCKVLWLFLGAEETEILSFGTTHVVALLLFPGLIDGGVLLYLLQLESSIAKLVSGSGLPLGDMR